MKRITVMLPDALHKELKLHAVNTEESISRIVASAVDTFLEDARSVPSHQDGGNHS